MSDPIRPDCDLCHEPLGDQGWTQWRLGIAEAERVAHTSCFEEMYGKEAEKRPANIESND